MRERPSTDVQQSVNEEMILEPQEEIRDVQESRRPVDIENKEHTPCRHAQLKVNENNRLSAPDDPIHDLLRFNMLTKTVHNRKRTLYTLYDAAASELISRKAGLAYPIRDGIPIMLVSEARQLKDVP